MSHHDLVAGVMSDVDAHGTGGPNQVLLVGKIWQMYHRAAILVLT